MNHPPPSPQEKRGNTLLRVRGMEIVIPLAQKTLDVCQRLHSQREIE